jgi:hypothetical protein
MDPQEVVPDIKLLQKKILKGKEHLNDILTLKEHTKVVHLFLSN